jgi:SAM-dependent methyltransferase
MPPVTSPLDVYRPLPWRERAFVRARWGSAPLQRMAELAPPAGLIADIGCGHGVLSAALALGRPERRVLGVDPDERKIALARRALATLPNVELRAGTAESLLPERVRRRVVRVDALHPAMGDDRIAAAVGRTYRTALSISQTARQTS